MLDDFKFRYVLYISSRLGKLKYTQISDHYLLTLYRLDQETHPDTLLPLGHGQHDVTRLAINFGFLALRRKGNFKSLEERQNYGLHFKDSVDNINQRLAAQA